MQMFVMLCPIPSMLGSGHTGFHNGFPRVSPAYLWSHLRGCPWRVASFSCACCSCRCALYRAYWAADRYGCHTGVPTGFPRGFQHGLAGFNFNRFHTAFHTGSCSGVLDRHRASPWGFTLGFTTGFRAAVTFTELVRRRTGTGFMMGFTTGFLQLLVFVVCKCVCPLAIVALPNSLPPW